MNQPRALRLRTAAVLATIAFALATGCCTPDSARVTWSTNQLVVGPSQSDPRGRTTLVVQTASNGPSHDEGERYQGYALFTASGSLVSSAGESSYDVTWLHPDPGEYIVVSRVFEGFSCQLVSAQAIVERGSTTFVDLRAVRSK